MQWKKTKYAGVRYREHKSRKHAGKPDQYFVIRYKVQGKLTSESVGWRSEGMNAAKAARLRGEIVQNIREGKRPQSLKEKRQMQIEADQREAQKAALIKKENITFAEVAKEYLAWAKNNKKSWRDDEIRYKKHLAKDLGKLPLKEISPLHLEKVKNKLFAKQLAPATVKHCLTLVRQIFNKAVIWELYNGENPIKKVNMPKLNNKRLRFLTHEEAAILLDALENRSKDLYHQALIALHTGMRFKEIAQLTWRDINFQENCLDIRTSKNNESRTIYMSPPIVDVLKERQESQQSELVFPSKNNTVQKSVSDTFERVVKQLGWNDSSIDPSQRVVFHTLRHTFASWLAIQGTPLFTIKELMGHKSITMTERYAHLIPSHKQAAILHLAEKFESKRHKEQS